MHIKPIGEGGTSKVYKVLGTDFENYALKVVDLTRVNHAMATSYEEEIRVLAKLRDREFIIRLVDWEVVPGKRIYIVMDQSIYFSIKN